jgi:hypothetical protein
MVPSDRYIAVLFILAALALKLFFVCLRIFVEYLLFVFIVQNYILTQRTC